MLQRVEPREDLRTAFPKRQLKLAAQKILKSTNLALRDSHPIILPLHCVQLIGMDQHVSATAGHLNPRKGRETHEKDIFASPIITCHRLTITTHGAMDIGQLHKSCHAAALLGSQSEEFAKFPAPMGPELFQPNNWK